MSKTIYDAENTLVSYIPQVKINLTTNILSWCLTVI